MTAAQLLTGDAREILPTLPAASVRCCVTSPPYWGLRDYGVDNQIGLEPTPEDYTAALVDVFREVRRVLTDDGTLWLNLGDSYASNGPKGDTHTGFNDRYFATSNGPGKQGSVGNLTSHNGRHGLKPKDLIGIPWRVAFALQADGWYLRSDIIWSKPNPMPESVTDRPTKAHEYVFLLAKSARYYWDARAVREDSVPSGWAAQRRRGEDTWAYGRAAGGTGVNNTNGIGGTLPYENGRNARTVWTISTQPYPEAHFATMPPELARRCIAAGSAPGDTILDPFGGSGTTAMVATGLGRAAISIDLNPAYRPLAVDRVGPLLVAD